MNHDFILFPQPLDPQEASVKRHAALRCRWKKAQICQSCGTLATASSATPRDLLGLTMRRFPFAMQVTPKFMDCNGKSMKIPTQDGY